MGLAEVAPNASIGRHMHNGVEAGYVLEGELVLMVEGQPDKTLKAGESYQMAPESIHDGAVLGKSGETREAGSRYSDTKMGFTALAPAGMSTMVRRFVEDFERLGIETLGELVGDGIADRHGDGLGLWTVIK